MDCPLFVLYDCPLFVLYLSSICPLYGLLICIAESELTHCFCFLRLRRAGERGMEWTRAVLVLEGAGLERQCQ